MSTNILNSRLADALLGDSPLLSLGVKITDSFVSQVLRDISSYSLSFEQWTILCLINNGSALYPSQLGQLMDLALPQITRLIDELESKDLIVRQVEVADRRKFKILLSSDGLQLIKQLNKLSSYELILDESLLSENEKSLYACISSKCLSGLVK